MPGLYIAKRGKEGKARAGFKLPFTPNSTGPVGFDPNTLRYLDVPMGDCYSGPAAKVKGGGITTHKISDCTVFTAAEWKGETWGRVYFTHVPGGNWKEASESKKALKDFASNVSLNNCYSLIMCPYWFGYSSFIAVPRKLQFPKSKLSVYIPNLSGGGLNIAVAFNKLGEFGEFGVKGESNSKSATEHFGFGTLKKYKDDPYAFFDYAKKLESEQCVVM